MFVIDLLIALFVALVLSGLFVTLMGWRRDSEGTIGAAFVFFFVILLLTSWAGGVWLGPFGPTFVGVPWVPFLLVGLITALILVAALPPRRPVRKAIPAEPEEERAAATALGGAFWLLLLLLIVAVAVGYC